jgi:hypothetical protein
MCERADGGIEQAMRTRTTARLFACLGMIAVGTAACGDKVCAGEGVDLRTPADTTVALHQSIVLAAGLGGTCGGPTGPVSADALTHWQVGDSSIVSVVVLDSLHARINGLALGTTSVMASWDGIVGSTTLVTVR